MFSVFPLQCEYPVKIGSSFSKPFSYRQPNVSVRVPCNVTYYFNRVNVQQLKSLKFEHFSFGIRKINKYKWNRKKNRLSKNSKSCKRWFFFRVVSTECINVQIMFGHTLPIGGYPRTATFNIDRGKARFYQINHCNLYSVYIQFSGLEKILTNHNNYTYYSVFRNQLQPYFRFI